MAGLVPPVALAGVDGDVSPLLRPVASVIVDTDAGTIGGVGSRNAFNGTRSG